MTYLERKIDTYLMQWKQEKEHKPLIVKGPRQVGKTESVRRFAEANYEHVIYINFVEEPKYKMITADGYNTDAIIKNISLLDTSKILEPQKTIIFFGRLQVQVEQNLSSNYISGIHLIKKSVEQFIRSVVA